jgi:hypothetical protein
MEPAIDGAMGRAYLSGACPQGYIAFYNQLASLYTGDSSKFDIGVAALCLRGAYSLPETDVQAYSSAFAASSTAAGFGGVQDSPPIAWGPLALRAATTQNGTAWLAGVPSSEAPGSFQVSLAAPRVADVDDIEHVGPSCTVSTQQFADTPHQLPAMNPGPHAAITMPSAEPQLQPQHVPDPAELSRSHEDVMPSLDEADGSKASSVAVSGGTGRLKRRLPSGDSALASTTSSSLHVEEPRLGPSQAIASDTTLPASGKKRQRGHAFH